MLTDDEIENILVEVLDLHGYDFREYSRDSLRRRIKRLFSLDKFADAEALRMRLRTDRNYIHRFVEQVTVNVTEMFRDPELFHFIRSQVLPFLGTKPFIRVWHAGCATGEEVFSLAILLHEAGLLHKSLLYATDLNSESVERARQGVFPLSQMKKYSENYLASGGQRDFSSYYTALYDHVKFNDNLRQRMVYSTHNLASDRSFNEFQLILCRNVLIYFDRPLQDRVFNLFDASLEKLGFLVLGTNETLKFSPIEENFRQVDRQRIWRKVK